MENLINFSEYASIDEVKRFIFGGNAHFTLESKVTGQHYTFEISKKAYGNQVLWFVALLTDSNQYTYLGKLISMATIQLTNKSKLTENAPAFKSIAWFLKALSVEKVPDTVIVYHSGRCGCCGRELTEPESIRCGIGPVCREMGHSRHAA